MDASPPEAARGWASYLTQKAAEVALITHGPSVAELAAMSSRERTTQRMPSMRPADLTEPERERLLPRVPPTAEIMEIAGGLDRWALRREKNVLFRDPTRATFARGLAARARFVAAALDGGVHDAAHEWTMLQRQIGDLLGGDPMAGRDGAFGAVS